METYGQGTDLTIVLNIVDSNSEQYRLDDKTVRVYLLNPRGKMPVCDYEVTDNVISFIYPGREQSVCGIYGIQLIVETGNRRRMTINVPHAFMIEEYECEIGTDSAEGLIEGNRLEITSVVNIYKIQPLIPEVGENGNWWVDGKDTGKPSVGQGGGGSSPFPVTGLFTLIMEIGVLPDGRQLTPEETASVFGSTESLVTAISQKTDIMSLEPDMDNMTIAVPFMSGVANETTAVAIYDLSGLGMMTGKESHSWLIIQVAEGETTLSLQDTAMDYVIEPLLTRIPHMGSEELEALANDIVGSIHGKKVWGMISSMNSQGSGNHSLIPVSVDVYSSALIYLTYTDDNGYICKITLSSADGEWKATDNVQNDPQAFDYIRVPELTDDYVVPANATYREHIYEIAVGATAYGITGAEGVKWADGTPPEVEANTTVVVSVINNLAVWGTFREDEA